MWGAAPTAHRVGSMFPVCREREWLERAAGGERPGEIALTLSRPSRSMGTTPCRPAHRLAKPASANATHSHGHSLIHTHTATPSSPTPRLGRAATSQPAPRHPRPRRPPAARGAASCSWTPVPATAGGRGRGGGGRTLACAACCARPPCPDRHHVVVVARHTHGQHGVQRVCGGAGAVGPARAGAGGSRAWHQDRILSALRRRRLRRHQRRR